MKVLENKGVDLNEKEFRGTLTLDAWHCGWQLLVVIFWSWFVAKYACDHFLYKIMRC